MPSLTRSTDSEHATRPDAAPTAPGSGGCRCSARDMRVVGYVREGERSRMDCQQPLRVVCRSCDALEQWPCGCSSAERCVPCSERNRRRNEQVVFTGLSQRETGWSYFLTLTAPGQDEHRQWVHAWNASKGSRPVCDCWDTGMTLAEWNAGAGGAWNRFRTSLRRHVAGVEFWRAAEVQERGALHHHAVLWSPAPLDPHQVQALAIAAGYGCVFDIREAKDAAHVARYVSKYVTKGDDRRRAAWLRTVVNRDTGELEERTDATYRTHSQSHGWGPTLKGLRAIARAQAQARARHLEVLAAVLAGDLVDQAVASAADSTDPPERDP